MSFGRKFVFNSGRYSTLEILSNQGLGLISFFILVRVMSKHEFGIWILYLSATTLLEQARIGFIKNGFIKHLGGSDESLKQTIFSASIVLNLLAFLVTALIAMVLALYVGPQLWDSPILQPMFLWYIPYAFLLTFYLQFKMVEQADMDFKGSFYTAFFRRIFFIALIVLTVIIQTPIQLMHLVYFNLGSIAVGVIASFLLARGKIEMRFSLDRQWLKKLSSFGLYTFGTNLSSMLFRSIDQFMLGAFPDKIFLAFYNTASRIANLVEIPANAMSSIVFPKSVQMIKENKSLELKEVYEKSVAIILLVVLPIVAMVLVMPEVFIYIVAGERYVDAVAYLRLIILFALFMPFMRQAGTVLDALGKPKINFYLTIVAAVVNVISNFLFIRLLGPIGAAYGTLLSYLLIIFVNQTFMKLYLKVEIMNIFKYIIRYYHAGLVFAIGTVRRKFSV